jgi:hypothetical protein
MGLPPAENVFSNYSMVILWRSQLMEEVKDNDTGTKSP